MDLRERVDETLLKRRAEIETQLERMNRTIAVAGGARVVRGGRNALKGSKVPPKYRSPSGETWAGRGAIAYRLQERAFGGLDRESLRFLHGLARHGGSPRRRLKPGTVLVPTIRASATPSPSSAMASTGRAQHDLPVGELQRVVMHVGTVHVELPEPGHLIGGHFNRRVARDIFGRHLLAPRALGGDGVRDGTGRWAPTCFSSPQGASTIRNSGRWRPRTLWKEPFLLVPGYPASGALR